MSALSGKRVGSKAGGGASASAGELYVLPRPLRRIVRFGAGVCAGRIPLPAHTGKLSLAAFYSTIAVYGMIIGGHTHAVTQTVTSTAGFGIEDIKVSGNEQTSEIDILQLLGLDGATSLMGLDIASARGRLSELPWVESVEVRKVYPKTVEVALTERKAYGIWQHGNDLSLIEKNGSVIAPLRDNKFASMPLFVGRDAETAASAVEPEFSKWPALAARVKAFVRVAGRRWDLHLDNGIVVKLPEDDIGAALALLSRFDAEQQILSRDIAAIDLRLKDRTAIQLTPAALVRREAALTERTKMLKKLGPSI
ncbi:MAG: cell division protein FtsQ/DivIB [Allorhizobium sp.]